MPAGRREFIQVLVFAGAATALGACGGDEANPDDGGGGGGGSQASCTDNGGKASSITGNHGHNLAIPKAHFAAGVTQAYDIQGVSDHPHTIELTAGQLATIAGGGTVTVTTVTDGSGHSHSVSCVCA